MKPQSLLTLCLISNMAMATDQERQLRPIEMPKPEYPETARALGHQGKVLVSFQILPNGMPTSVEIKESSYSSILDEAAVTSVKKWRFSPATNPEENAIFSRVMVPFLFVKDHEGTIMQKTCGDLNADVQFFRVAFPDKPLSHMRISGLTQTMLRQSGELPRTITVTGDGFSRFFETTVQRCKANPNDTYGNALLGAISGLNH